MSFPPVSILILLNVFSSEQFFSHKYRLKMVQPHGVDITFWLGKCLTLSFLSGEYSAVLISGEFYSVFLNTDPSTTIGPKWLIYIDTVFLISIVLNQFLSSIFAVSQFFHSPKINLPCVPSFFPFPPSLSLFLPVFLSRVICLDRVRWACVWWASGRSPCVERSLDGAREAATQLWWKTATHREYDQRSKYIEHNPSQFLF